MKREVYLAYTRSCFGTTLVKVYSKSNYQTAYNWLADIADKHGVKVQAGPGNWAAFVRYVRPEDVEKDLTQIGIDCGETWYLERHEVH